MAPTTTRCSVCAISIDLLVDQPVKCSVCFSPTHELCSIQTNFGEEHRWTCLTCLKNEPTQNEPLTVKHFNLIMGQFATLNCSIQSCDTKINSLTDLVVSHTASIQTCESNIIALQVENSELRTTIKSLETQISESYDECRERLSRENNIIVMGLAEDRSKSDFDIIKPILEAVKPNATNHIVNHFRIGTGRNGPKLLKVCFSSASIARDLLRNKNKLTGSQLKNIRIKSDTTPKQRDYLNKLRTELDQRTRGGELDLTIKYVKNRPQIVKKTKRNRENDSPTSNTPKVAKHSLTA